MTSVTFSALTLDEQLAHLSGALDSTPTSELLTLCRVVRDHAPMAWLSTQLLERGWLSEAEHRTLFASFLIEQSETAVNKVLRTILDLKLDATARRAPRAARRSCPRIVPQDRATRKPLREP